MKKRLIVGALLLSLLLQPYFVVEAKATEIQFKQTIASGSMRVYAVSNNRILYYWGSKDYSGINRAPERAKPVKLADDVIGVYAQSDIALAVKSDNSLWMIRDGWEQNGHVMQDAELSDKIADDVKEVAVSYNAAMYLKTDGTVWAWKCGMGVSDTPKQVMDNVKHISLSYGSSFALKNDGVLWGWGDNYNGTLGVKTDVSDISWDKPVKVMEDVAGVHGAIDNVFAVKTDGTLWGWGHLNDLLLNKGVLETCVFSYPDGSKHSGKGYFTPVQLMENVAVVTGRRHIAVIKTDGSLWTWGSNESGELGDGTTISRYTPKKLLDNAASVTAGDNCTMVLLKDGTLWGCGSNACGEMGLGSYDKLPRSTLIKITEDIALPDSVINLPSSWAKDSIRSAIQQGLVPIELQARYEQNISREEFVALITALICKQTGKDMKTIVSQYDQLKDVRFTDTTNENIISVAGLGIINGVGDNRFEPAGYITREQAAKILMRTAEFLGLPSKESSHVFADDAQISSWAKEGVSFCNSYQIMNGTGDDHFSPSGYYSIEMSIVTVMRLYDLFIWKACN